MKKFTRILIMLFLSCSTLTAQQITQQFTFTQNDLQISQSEGFDIVTLTQDDYLNGEIYAGKPQLPLKHFKLLLPKGASATGVNISINSEQQIAGSFYLYPVQMPVYPNYESPPSFVEPDPTVYNSNNPFPADNILAFENNGFRDYNYVSISFVPVKYIPLSRQLYLLTNITVIVNYSITPLIASHKLRPYGKVDENAYSFIETLVTNPIQIGTFYPEVADKIVQYRASGEMV